jgi:hypothetical protein
MKTHLIAGKRTKLMLAAIAGGCLLAPATALARVPYQSAAKNTTAATSATAPSTPPVSIPKQASAAVADCTSGSCVRPATGLGLPAVDDHRYGTTIDWSDTPAAAGKLAAKESKLVFLIQLSGDFTNNEFT